MSCTMVVVCMEALLYPFLHREAVLHACFSLAVSEVLPFFVAFPCRDVDGSALESGVSFMTFVDPLRFSFLTGEGSGLSSCTKGLSSTSRIDGVASLYSALFCSSSLLFFSSMIGSYW